MGLVPTVVMWWRAHLAVSSVSVLGAHVETPSAHSLRPPWTQMCNSIKALLLSAPYIYVTRTARAKRSLPVKAESLISVKLLESSVPLRVSCALNLIPSELSNYPSSSKRSTGLVSALGQMWNCLTLARLEVPDATSGSFWGYRYTNIQTDLKWKI